MFGLFNANMILALELRRLFTILTVAALPVLMSAAGARAGAPITVHPQIIVDNANAMYQVGTTNILTGLSATVPDAPTNTEVNVGPPSWTWSVVETQFSSSAGGQFGSPPAADGSKWGFEPANFAQTIQQTGDSSVPLYTQLQTPGYWQFQVTVSVKWTSADGSQIWSGTAQTVEVGSPSPSTGGNNPVSATNTTSATPATVTATRVMTTVVAASSGSTTQPNSPQETAEKVEILWQGKDIAGTNGNKIIVGQHVALIGQLVPLTTVPPSYQWTIDNSPITNFYVSGDQKVGHVVPLASGSESQPTVGFYWYKGSPSGANATTKVVITSGGASLQANAGFLVLRPSITLKATVTGLVATDTNYLVGGQKTLALHFGTSLKPPGITFNASSVPSGFTGSLKWVQTISSFAQEYQQAATNQWFLWSAPAAGLDTSYPYPSSAAGTEADDSPGMALTTSMSQARFRLNATMYVMFTPTGTDSIPVPMGSATWSVTMATTYVKSNWTAPASTVQTPTVNQSPDYPNWSAVVNQPNANPPLAYQPENGSIVPYP